MKEPDIYDYIKESKGHSGIENFDVSIGQLPSYRVHRMLDRDVSEDEATFKRVTDFLNRTVESLLKGMVQELNAVLRGYGYDIIRIDETVRPYDNGYFAVHAQKGLEIIRRKDCEHIVGIARENGVQDEDIECLKDFLDNRYMWEAPSKYHDLVGRVTLVKKEHPELEKMIRERADRSFKVNQKIADIFNKYVRPKLYKSLFYAFCQLYETAKGFREMHTRYGKKNRTLIDQLSEYERRGVAHCRTLLKRSSKIEVTLLRTESTEIGKQELHIGMIAIRDDTRNNGLVPKEYFPIVLFDLYRTPALKWMLETSGCTFMFKDGGDFDAVKEWLAHSLVSEKINGFDKRFAKSLNGLYRYVMDCRVADYLSDDSVRGLKKGKAIEFIRQLLDLPQSALPPLKNYINRK